MEKRAICSPFSYDGMIHKVESGTPQKPLTEQQLEELKKRNFDKSVCLNCSHKKCRGNQKCFKKERQKVLNESQNTNASEMYGSNEQGNQ